jgi:type II secretion system protein N
VTVLRLGRGLGILAAGALLTLLFVAILFPYDRYREAVERGLGEVTGARVHVAGLGPDVGRVGPVLALRGVELRFPDDVQLTIDEAHLRPALSSSWLRGEPALRLLLAGPLGGVNGTLWSGGQRGFVGTLDDLDLAALRLERMVDGLDLRGRADADLDLQGDANRLSGRVSFSARDGLLTLPFLGIPLPYETAQGSIQLKETEGLAIETFQLNSADLALHASGTIGNAPVLENAKLDLRARLEVRDPDLRSVLGPVTGLRGDGTGDLRLSGTLRNPMIQ